MTSSEKIINDCVSPFNETQRARLKALSKVQVKGKDYSATPNDALEQYIAQLKAIYPNMFHTKNTLKDRVFMDTPTSIIPYARAVRTLQQSPHRIVPV